MPGDRVVVNMLWRHCLNINSTTLGRCRKWQPGGFLARVEAGTGIEYVRALGILG